MSDAIVYVDPDAERAVLGAVLLDNDVLPLARTILTHERFGEPRHATIWQAMVDIADRGEPINVLTLVSALKALRDGRGMLNTVGGPQYVGELTDHVGTSAHIEAHARLVSEIAAARAGAQQAQDMAAVSRMGLAPRQLLSRLHQLSALIPAGIDGGEKLYDAETHATAAWETILAAQGAQKVPARFGVESLDGDRSMGFEGALGGMFAEQLIFLGGEPGSGKTTLADQAAEETARAGRRVLVFPTEMSGPELARRRAATRAGISQARMRAGILSSDELTAIADALADRANLPIFTFDDVANIESIRARVLAEAARGDVGLVVVDYFQMLTSVDEKGRDENRAEAKRWDALKRVARDAKVPLLVVSSLTKEGQKGARGKDGPSQTDARGSGPEYASDVMVFLTCEHPEDARREVMAHIKKNRQGPLGTVPLSFETARGRFTSKTAAGKPFNNVVPLRVVEDFDAPYEVAE